MKTTIGSFDADTRTVSVTFEEGGIMYQRDVNACLTADGAYDADAMAERVGQVALGVAHKIELGVIKAAPPVDESAN